MKVGVMRRIREKDPKMMRSKSLNNDYAKR
jgi:hypothetical protein